MKRPSPWPSPFGCTWVPDASAVAREAKAQGRVRACPHTYRVGAGLRPVTARPTKLPSIRSLGARFRRVFLAFHVLLALGFSREGWGRDRPPAFRDSAEAAEAVAPGDDAAGGVEVAGPKSRRHVARHHDTGTDYAAGQYVHQWIAAQGYLYFASQVLGSDLDHYVGRGDSLEQWIESSFDEQNSGLVEGTYAEDWPDRDPLFQGGPVEPLGYPYLNHFVQHTTDHRDVDIDSDTLLGIFPGRSAYAQALELWAHALEDYPYSKARAYYRLGHVAHLVADLCVPAHVNEDSHAVEALDSDYYEHRTVAYKQQFRWWYFGGDDAAVWRRSIPIPASLRDLFYRTARYTGDYDSAGQWGCTRGIVSSGGRAYLPGDYPTTWHRPDAVDLSDGFEGVERQIMCEDLMPYAIMRTADLIRLWYSHADRNSPPIARMLFPGSTDSQTPDRQPLDQPVLLRCLYEDPESGVVRESRRLEWSYRADLGWTPWEDIGVAIHLGQYVFPAGNGPGLYRFRCRVENGAGIEGVSEPAFLSLVVREDCVVVEGDLDYGYVLPGVPVRREVSVRNACGTPVAVSLVECPERFEVMPREFTLEAGAFQQVAVVFAESRVGGYAGNIVFDYARGQDGGRVTVRASALTVPAFLERAPAHVGNGQIELHLHAPADSQVVLEQSPDLVRWEPMAELRFVQTELVFREDVRTNAEPRFYRLVVEAKAASDDPEPR